MKHSQLVKGYIFIIVSAVIFGCNPLMVTRIYDTGVNAMTLVLLRNLLAVPVLALFAYRQKKTLKIPAAAVGHVACVGIMGCAITQVVLFSSYSYIASGTATVFHFIYPAVVVLGGVVIFRERLSMGNLISIAVCVLGISLFYTPDQALDWRGSALALLSGVTYAIFIMQLDHFRYPQISGFLLCLYTSATSGIFLLAVCLATQQLILPESVYGWVLCFGYSLIVNFGAMVLFQQGTFLIGGRRASILSTLEPITSLIVGALVFQEVIGVRTAVGSVLVILASVMIAMSDFKKQKQDI